MKNEATILIAAVCEKVSFDSGFNMKDIKRSVLEKPTALVTLFIMRIQEIIQRTVGMKHY